MNTSYSKLISINIIAALLFLGVGTSNVNNIEWELVTEEGVTKVYTRKSEQSSIKEIRMTTTFKSDLETFKNVLSNVPGYPDWVYKCSDSTKLPSESESDYHYYLITNMPYPITDRDLVVQTKNWQIGHMYYSQSFSKPDFITPIDGMVRVPRFTSYWEVTPLDDQTLEIEYEASTDPGGFLPAWVINLGITKGPIITMKSLKKEVERKYELK